jgi:hypothetical protein
MASSASYLRVMAHNLWDQIWAKPSTPLGHPMALQPGPRFQQIGDGDGGASPSPDKSPGDGRHVPVPGQIGDGPGDGDGDGDRGVRALAAIVGHCSHLDGPQLA